MKGRGWVGLGSLATNDDETVTLITVRSQREDIKNDKNNCLEKRRNSIYYISSLAG